jgi:hypothetical protein
MAKRKHVWFVVDDQPEADAFCSAFSNVGGHTEFIWERLTPSESETLSP